MSNDIINEAMNLMENSKSIMSYGSHNNVLKALNNMDLTADQKNLVKSVLSHLLETFVMTMEKDVHARAAVALKEYPNILFVDCKEKLLHTHKQLQTIDDGSKLIPMRSITLHEFVNIVLQAE